MRNADDHPDPIAATTGDEKDDENNVKAEAQEAGRDAALVSKKAKVIEQHVKLVMKGVLPLEESDSKYFKEFISRFPRRLVTKKKVRSHNFGVFH